MSDAQSSVKSPSLPWLITIYLALLALLALTIIIAELPMGSFALLIALAIAATKAVLIILYFMHVRYAPRVTLIFVVAGLLWLSILFSLTFAEYIGRSHLTRAQPLSPFESIAPVSR